MSDIELKPCPICGKKATVIHLYDSYDKADFGWDCGCPAYKIDDGIHDRVMRVTALTKEDAIKGWKLYEIKVAFVEGLLRELCTEYLAREQGEIE